jgi:hypothetical protein
MWTQIIPQTPTWNRGFAPALTHFRPVAVEMGLEVDDLTQLAPGDEPLHRKEVGIPAPVVEDRELTLSTPCE